MRRALLIGFGPVLLSALLLVAAPSGCFKPKVPDVAFTCGDGGACPDGYECRADGCCHKIGSPLDEHGACGLPLDAAVNPDAAVDAAVDAAANPDAAQIHDAAVDAAPQLDSTPPVDASPTLDASP